MSERMKLTVTTDTSKEDALAYAQCYVLNILGLRPTPEMAARRDRYMALRNVSFKWEPE